MRRRQRSRVACRCRRRSCPCSTRSARATGSCTSVAARFRPLAPVGGTMCAASPARNSRPKRIGSATKLRSGAMLFSIDGPGDQRLGGFGVEAAAQFVPERVVATSPRPCRPASTARSSGCASASACCTARSRARGWSRSARATPAACRTGCPASRTGRPARRSASAPAGTLARLTPW